MTVSGVLTQLVSHAGSNVAYDSLVIPEFKQLCWCCTSSDLAI